MKKIIYRNEPHRVKTVHLATHSKHNSNMKYT